MFEIIKQILFETVSSFTPKAFEQSLFLFSFLLVKVKIQYKFLLSSCEHVMQMSLRHHHAWHKKVLKKPCFFLQQGVSSNMA